MTWSEAANLAVNQTLMRSINTSVIALLPVAGLLFVGAGLLGVGTLKDLALVLFVGLAAGAYSSIVLATPIVADLKEREPEVQALRRRVLARRSSAARQAGARAPADRPGGQRPAGRAPAPRGPVAPSPSCRTPSRPTSSSSRRPRSGRSARRRDGRAAPRRPAAASRRQRPAAGQEAPVSAARGRAAGSPLDELIASLTVDVPDHPEPGRRCSAT